MRNLPESDVKAAIAVLVGSVSVSAGLVAHDALAVGLQYKGQHNSHSMFNRKYESVLREK